MSFPVFQFVKATPMFRRKKAATLAASLLAAAALSFSTPMSLVSKAMATDLDTIAVDQGEQGKFYRLGLNKSAVIKLPAEVRDVIIGNPSIVDAVVKTKTTAYLFAKQPGTTNIFFLDAEGRQVLNLDLEVALDTTAIRKLINRTLRGNRITVDTANNNVILGGIARNALEAKTAVDLATQFISAGSFFSSGSSLINIMQIEGEDQVMLKVKVVEIQRDVIKQFGINFSAILDVGKLAVNLASISPFSNGLLSPNSGYKSTYTSGGMQLQGLLRAMEGDGLVRTLAEPNLTALTGESASFLAGGEFPYQNCTTSSASGSTCTTAFKQFGVSVSFTPTVIEEGRINLKISTDVSDLGATTADGTPSINRRSASTVLELPSGGSMMLAGLIREATRQNLNGTPGLRKLPVLGSLFRSRDFVSNETELVIFVTPYLVRPTSEKNMASPDDGFNPPTDRQAIFMGRLNKVYGNQNGTPKGKYNGNVGFIVE